MLHCMQTVAVTSIVLTFASTILKSISTPHGPHARNQLCNLPPQRGEKVASMASRGVIPKPLERVLADNVPKEVVIQSRL